MYEKKEVLTVLYIIGINRKSELICLVDCLFVDYILCQHDFNNLVQQYLMLTCFITDTIYRWLVDNIVC